MVEKHQDVSIEIYSNYPCKCKLQLIQEEERIIRLHDDLLNKQHNSEKPK